MPLKWSSAYAQQAARQFGLIEDDLLDALQVLHTQVPQLLGNQKISEALLAKLDTECGRLRRSAEIADGTVRALRMADAEMEAAEWDIQKRFDSISGNSAPEIRPGSSQRITAAGFTNEAPQVLTMPEMHTMTGGTVQTPDWLTTIINENA